MNFRMSSLKCPVELGDKSDFLNFTSGDLVRAALPPALRVGNGKIVER